MSNLIEVSVRVWANRNQASLGVNEAAVAGVFTAHLPALPSVGSFLNVANVGDLDWEGDGESGDFYAHLSGQGLQVPSALKVTAVAFQIDDAGGCLQIRVETRPAIDPTVE